MYNSCCLILIIMYCNLITCTCMLWPSEWQDDSNMIPWNTTLSSHPFFIAQSFIGIAKTTEVEIPEDSPFFRGVLRCVTSEFSLLFPWGGSLTTPSSLTWPNTFSSHIEICEAWGVHLERIWRAWRGGRDSNLGWCYVMFQVFSCLLEVFAWRCCGYCLYICLLWSVKSIFVGGSSTITHAQMVNVEHGCMAV